jgi:hypothetical protein
MRNGDTLKRVAFLRAPLTLYIQGAYGVTLTPTLKCRTWLYLLRIPMNLKQITTNLRLYLHRKICTCCTWPGGSRIKAHGSFARLDSPKDVW